MSSRLRKSAQGRECQIRIPDICNGNPETTVLCHLPGGGTGGKRSNIHGAYGCSACHDVVDGRHRVDMASEIIMLWFLDGVIRTQQIMLDEGLIIERK